VAVASAGAGGLADATNRAAPPLEVIARGLDIPAVARLIAAGAVTAMFGVLLSPPISSPQGLRTEVLRYDRIR
jgi:APA family basic amino acid/polyamine antiporter